MVTRTGRVHGVEGRTNRMDNLFFAYGLIPPIQSSGRLDTFIFNLAGLFRTLLSLKIALLNALQFTS